MVVVLDFTAKIAACFGVDEENGLLDFEYLNREFSQG